MALNYILECPRFKNKETNYATYSHDDSLQTKCFFHTQSLRFFKVYIRSLFQQNRSTNSCCDVQAQAKGIKKSYWPRSIIVYLNEERPHQSRSSFLFRSDWENIKRVHHQVPYNHGRKYQGRTQGDICCEDGFSDLVATC
jgi:hypothetical protein